MANAHCLILSYTLLKNGQRYLNNLPLQTVQDFQSTFDQFLSLCMKELEEQTIWARKKMEKNANRGRQLPHDISDLK